MPFNEINVTEEICTRREASVDFDKAWTESRSEIANCKERLKRGEAVTQTKS